VEILNLGGAEDSYSPAPKSRKKLRVILGIGALAAVTGLGSTLAANISLNGGGNVEFGQGVATTAACDDTITLTPVSTFVNSAYAGESTFGVTAIQISDIDLTPEGWDVDAGAWHTGFDDDGRTWDEGFEQYEGQYLNANDEWVNTCENKVLMLRAYTDNEAFDEYTVDGSVNSPLFLNSLNSNGALRNAGVGFKVFHDGGSEWDDYNDDLYADESEPTAMDALDYGYTINDSPDFFGSEINAYGFDSTFVIELDDDPSIAPMDSRWVDKLTLESADTLPTSWNAEVFTVSYNTGDGGSVVDNTPTTFGGSVEQPSPNPTRAGFGFDGWSTTDGGEPISFPYIHNQSGSFTLWARWMPDDPS
jgi:uncharacterized repeat protein (TIGR02543 family)